MTSALLSACTMTYTRSAALNCAILLGVMNSMLSPMGLRSRKYALHPIPSIETSYASPSPELYTEQTESGSASPRDFSQSENPGIVAEIGHPGSDKCSAGSSPPAACYARATKRSIRHQTARPRHRPMRPIRIHPLILLLTVRPARRKCGMTPILGEGRAVLLTPPGITHAKEARDGLAERAQGCEPYPVEGQARMDTPAGREPVRNRLRRPPTGCQPGRHRHVSSAKQTRNAFPPSHQTRGNGPIRQIVGGVNMNDIRKACVRAVFDEFETQGEISTHSRTWMRRP